MLKTLHALVTGHREIKLVLTRKLPLFWLALIVLVGDNAACCGRKVINSLTQLGNPWTGMMTSLKRYAHGSNSVTSVMRETN